MLTTLRRLFGWLSRPPPATAGDSEFRLLAEHSNDVIIRCGMDGVAKYVSPSSVYLFGRSPEEMVGKRHMEYVLPEDRAGIDAVRDRHTAGKATGLATFRIVKPDGTTVWVEGSGKMIGDPASGSAELVIVMRDISERKAMESQLSEMAMTDGLTGLANRRAFDLTIENEWRRAGRSDKQLSLLLLDLDRFKNFNDRYGHQAGDDCLRAVSARVKQTIRQAGDFAARYGGEEIAVILPETSFEGAATAAEAIRAAIASMRIPHADNMECGGFVTASIGAASALAAEGATAKMPAGLIHAADLALYKAKRNGRNRVEVGLLLTSDRPERGMFAA